MLSPFLSGSLGLASLSVHQRRALLFDVLERHACGVLSLNSRGGFFFFLMFLLFIFERERETEVRAGQGQRERETQNPKQAPGSEPSARGSNSRTVRS